MAFVPTVTKQSISRIGDGLYEISIKLSVSDDAIQEEIFSATVTERYNTGHTDLSGLRGRLISGLQAKWDKFIAEYNLYESAAFDSMIAQIQTAANGYIS